MSNPIANEDPSALTADPLTTDTSSVQALSPSVEDYVTQYTFYVLSQLAASDAYSDAQIDLLQDNQGIFNGSPSEDYTSAAPGTPGSGGPILPGDLDLDGDVDSEDLATLLANWETDQSAFVDSVLAADMPLFKGDIDGNLYIDINDLTIQLSFWTGELTQADILAIEQATGLDVVPEPATLALLSLGGLALLRRRR